MAERRQLLQESLLAIERLEEQLAASERAKHEPIAIIGAGCRYAGGIESPDDLWRVVRDGIDAVSEVPADRWDADAYYDPNPKAPGKMVTKRGGFLRQVDRFDPQQFGISPREAATMDPQQRLLLETASEALESAGLATDRLVGSATGVFVGITTSDYGQLMRLGGPEHSDVYSATGAALNAAAGRLSFTFGFQGPCASFDTACSSSLVAVHLACQSLRTGESNLALAGGVNVILSPDAMILFSKWGMMAPDGACKTFDAAADGFVRAEGCAVIALKRLSDAHAAGDPILAVIRGSASNSDGRSSGLTVPNGPAQQAVLRTALASAELEPSDIDYVEAHGTGTSLGDPIEVEALGAVMAEGRSPERPLLIGSIKTNIGHAEASSGLAGLLKVVMSLRHEAIPPHLHFTRPNPGIAWSSLPISVPTKLTPWPRSVRPRRAGVSSFGFSGTNAHVILEEAPVVAPAPADRGRAGPDEKRTSFLVPLSARTDAAARELAGRYADFLAGHPNTSLAELAATTTTGRAHSLHRVALVADSAVDLERDLRSIATGELPPGAAEGTIRAGDRPKIAFLFTGQGAQYTGMGRGLYEAEPVFRDAIDRSAAILAPLIERPLIDVLFPADPASKLISETAYTQPALFALEVALSELWASWGITPSIVIGHSVGEYVAACVAGVFGFEDGLALIAERGRLMQALPSGGGMAAVHADEAHVAARLAKAGGRLAIAAVNAPEETVVAGDSDALEEFVRGCAADGVKTRILDVSHAFHSHRLDPMLDAFERRAASVKHTPPRIALVSNLTGSTWAAGTQPDAHYWRRHAREPVRFAAGIEALRAAGVTALVEVGPHATLLALAGRALPTAKWTTASSLRKSRPDRREMLSALATLYTRGANVRWDALAGGPRISLPTYPFQRERHWVEAVNAVDADAAPKQRPTTAGGAHPLLGERQRSPQAGASFLAEIGRDAPAFLADHVVLGTVLLPGTAYLELGLAAARALGMSGEIAIESFVIEAPLALAPDTTRLLHVTVEAATPADRSAFVVRSTTPDDANAPWIVHAKGYLRPRPGASSSEARSVVETRASCPNTVDVSAYYTRLAGMGLEYGATFRLVQSLVVGEGVAVGVVELPEGTSQASWVLHPAILDAAFHLLGAALLAGSNGEPEHVYLPVGIDEVRVCGAIPSRVHGTARVRERGSDAATRIADLRLEDDAGNLVALVSGLQIRKVTPQTLQRALSLGGIAPQSYRVRWAPLSEASNEDARCEGRFVLLGDRAGFADELARALAERGAETTVVTNLPEGRGVHTLTELLKKKGAIAWVIDCAAIDPSAGDDPVKQARAEYLRLLAIVQATAAAGARAGFCLLTRGAQAIAAGDDVDLPRSPLLGLARTVAAERGEAPALRIDLDPAAPPDARVVVSALAGLAGLARLASVEPEMGVRNGNVFVPRFEHGGTSSTSTRAPDQRDVLRIRERGALDALRVERDVRRRPEAGEVELEVRAAGLNFRDVLNALGMYPGDAGALGSECSGIVTAVGSGVTGLAVGDEVVGFATDSFASHAIAPASMVVKKPANVGFAQAVTLPNTYLTAAQALRAGGLRAGQRVLIHAAAGGVGLAAVRLAKRAGADVIATAGSPEKRAFALAEGATRVFDSRSASFADDVMRATDGAGVDLVLNSLSGALIAAGMRVVKRGGTFIEIGKKDIWTHAEAAERAPGVRYEIIDLGQAMTNDVGSVRALFEELLEDVASRKLAPLPLRAFPLADAVSAFRFMATARHIGKVVLVPDGPKASTLSARSDATYLITGGLGGLGFATAEWLAKHGAGELVLVGRSAPTPEAEARVEQLRKTGCKVTAVACDIGDRKAVRALFDGVLAPRPPLRGIFHTAGVLADAPLGEQNAERFDAVAGGKVDGAWQLSELSSQTPLDFFVLYSSSSALLGSPGQANYAASNAFLDGLAAHRRARGQAATSVAWGAWAEVGMASRLSDATKKRWTQLGVGWLDPKDALDALEGALLRSDGHIAIAALDPSRVAAQASPAVRALLGTVAGARTAKATKTVENDALTSEMKDADSLTALRAAADTTERLTLLHRYVHREAARVLGFNSSALDAETPLSTLGFDSLMAVQLKNRVESDLAVEIPLVQFLTSPSIVGLTSEIAARLGSGTAPVAPTTSDTWEEGSL